MKKKAILIASALFLSMLLGFLWFDWYRGNHIDIQDVYLEVEQDQLQISGANYLMNVKSYLQNLANGDLGSLTMQGKGVSRTMVEIMQLIAQLTWRSAKLLLPGLGIGVFSGMFFGSLVFFLPKRVQQTVIAWHNLLTSVPDLLLILLLQMAAIKIDQWTGTYLIGVVEVYNKPVHFLPIFTIALPISAYLFLYTVNACREALHQDYIRTLQGKGLPQWYVFAKHVLRPAADSVLSVIPKMAAFAASGLVVVERLFNVMGITWSFQGLLAFSPPYVKLLATMLIIFALYFFVIKILTQLLRLWVNPLLRR